MTTKKHHMLDLVEWRWNSTDRLLLLLPTTRAQNEVGVSFFSLANPASRQSFISPQIPLQTLKRAAEGHQEKSDPSVCAWMSTSFSATCSRLSQCLKHNGADLHISPQPHIETLHLFPCPSPEVDGSSSSKPPGKSQLMILYGGKVLTFDDFPADKAGDLMSMAGGAAMAGNNLPMARRRSLHHFLQKRKDRINSKAPYQLNGSSSKDVSEKPWLGLDLNAVCYPPEFRCGDINLLCCKKYWR